MEGLREAIDKELFNMEPVIYCKQCLSLRIRGLDNLDYCDNCGSVDLGTPLTINEWCILYENKYNKKYI